jgi:hypothetical protein
MHDRELYERALLANFTSEPTNELYGQRCPSTCDRAAVLRGNPMI